ncbi:MAG TPA: deoxyribose-phosphate aldolase [Capillibacterium sp.]
MEREELIAKISRELLVELGEEGFRTVNRPPRKTPEPQIAGPADLAKLIDHTLLKPEATYSEIERLCFEAKEYGFASVCVNPSYVRLAARLLGGGPVKVCTVVGFPLGATTYQVKAAEAKEAVACGATELDMVINLGALKSGFYNLVYQEIKAVVEAAASQALTKVIIETCYLNSEEKIKACLLALYAGADFVKTSTGFGKAGATTEDVALMRQVVGGEMGVKAAGGIRDLATAEAMIKAGANRIGASAGVKIMQELAARMATGD